MVYFFRCRSHLPIRVLPQRQALLFHLCPVGGNVRQVFGVNARDFPHAPIRFFVPQIVSAATLLLPAPQKPLLLNPAIR